jgi:hypothetical protein
VGQQGVEALGVGQDALHHLAVDDRLVGVGHVDAAGLAHQADLGHLLALQPLGRRAGAQDAGRVDVARAAQDEVDHAGVVDGRIGVGLDDEAGHPAGRRGPGGAGQGFLGLGPGLAGLDPQVDQAGGQHGAVAVDDADVLGQLGELAALGDVGDHALGDDDAAGTVVAALGIDQAGVDQGEGREWGRSCGGLDHAPCVLRGPLRGRLRMRSFVAAEVLILRCEAQPSLEGRRAFHLPCSSSR